MNPNEQLLAIPHQLAVQLANYVVNSNWMRFPKA